MEPTETVVDGMSAILSEVGDVTTVAGDVFGIITSNPYLAFFAAIALVGAGVHVFNLIKSAAH